jgi:hypothetical protein
MSETPIIERGDGTGYRDFAVSEGTEAPDFPAGWALLSRTIQHDPKNRVLYHHQEFAREEFCVRIPWEETGEQ